MITALWIVWAIVACVVALLCVMVSIVGHTLNMQIQLISRLRQRVSELERRAIRFDLGDDNE